MPDAPLTAAESARLDAVWAAICEAQVRREAPLQTLAADDWLHLGLTPQDLADARALGFTAAVDEYLGPDGSGWTLRVTLARDGAMWTRTFHAGPEGWRAQPWRVQVEVPSWL